MTPIQRTEAIRDLLSANLPALLSTAGLDNFDEYLNKSPLRSDDKEIAVYIDFDDNMTDSKNFGVLIQAQIYGKDQVQEYHSVIMPFLEESLTADIIGYQSRSMIEADLWPMDIATSTAFAYYKVSFGRDLDDCQ